jgi:hypothetical protein
MKQEASIETTRRTLLPGSTKERDKPYRGSHRIGCAFLALVLAGTVAFAAPAASQPGQARPGHPAGSQTVLPRPGTGHFVQRFVRELRSNGLEVTVGYPKLYTQADCAYSYSVFKNCFGNNPAGPYILPVVKPWPEEYVDPAMKNGFGRTRPGYSVAYRLDPREAIVVFGRMPPPARYIALQTWVFTTGWLSNESPWNDYVYDLINSSSPDLVQYLFAKIPGNPNRVMSFSSINNNINNVVMEKESGLPWDQIRYFVITPDQLTDQAVREVLGTLGVDRREVFTGSVPQGFTAGERFAPWGPNPTFVPELGLDADNVDFVTILRYSRPDDEQAADAWRKSLPLTVLRIRRPHGDPVPYDVHEADERPTVAEAELSNGLSALVDAVETRAQTVGLNLQSNQGMIDILNELGQFGPACRKIGMNCLGDNQDASYFLMRAASLDEGQVYAVIGTLATETENALLVGLSVNDVSLLKGALDVPDTELKGSANGYNVVAEPEKFFIHFFTRDCDAIAAITDGACTTITPSMVPLAGDDKALGDPELHGKFSAAVRAYVAVESERGPDPRLQLRPRALTFSQR